MAAIAGRPGIFKINNFGVRAVGLGLWHYPQDQLEIGKGHSIMRSGPTESDLILREMRKLNLEMNQATPDVIQMRKFRDLFNELDALLKTGALLPTSWITRLNFTQLPTETTHTITDFDPPPENTPGYAWCGHRHFPGTEYCTKPDCGNHYSSHRG